MKEFLGFLLLGLFYAFYILMSALFISFSIHSFKKEKYFCFGANLMIAVFYAISLTELMFKV